MMARGACNPSIHSGLLNICILLHGIQRLSRSTLQATPQLASLPVSCALELLEYESLSKLGVELADCVARGFDLGEMRGDDTPENGVEIFVRNISLNDVNKFQMPRGEGTHKVNLL